MIKERRHGPSAQLSCPDDVRFNPVSLSFLNKIKTSPQSAQVLERWQHHLHLQPYHLILGLEMGH